MYFVVLIQTLSEATTSCKVLRHSTKKLDACHTSARYSTHPSLPSIQSCPPSFKHDLVLRTQCLCSYLLQCLLRLGILMIHVMNRNLHSFLSREHMNPQLTCSQCQWLHSLVGRTLHRYRKVTGSNLVEVLNFFSGFFTQLRKLHSLRRSFFHFQKSTLIMPLSDFSHVGC